MPDKIMWPAGVADVKTPAFAATIPVLIENRKTLIKLALTGNATLDLTIDAEVARAGVGTEVQLEVSSDATARTLTLGTGIDGPNIVGVISKTFSQGFELSNDGLFKPVGAAVQVN
ncbi:MAG: hypothetical protein ACRC1W_13245 [Shewanella sp.]